MTAAILLNWLVFLFGLLAAAFLGFAGDAKNKSAECLGVGVAFLAGSLVTCILSIHQWQTVANVQSAEIQTPSIKVDEGSVVNVAPVTERREGISYDFSSGGIVDLHDKSYVFLKMHEDPLQPKGAKVVDDLLAQLERERGKEVIDFEFDGLSPDRSYVAGMWVTWGIPLETKPAAVSAEPVVLEEE